MNQIVRLYCNLQARATAERGAGLAEYALLLFLIAIAVAAAATALQGQITAVFNQMKTALTN